jgi:hypothetical protein
LKNFLFLSITSSLAISSKKIWDFFNSSIEYKPSWISLWQLAHAIIHFFTSVKSFSMSWQVPVLLIEYSFSSGTIWWNSNAEKLLL